MEGVSRRVERMSQPTNRKRFSGGESAIPRGWLVLEPMYEMCIVLDWIMVLGRVDCSGHLRPDVNCMYEVCIVYAGNDVLLAFVLCGDE